MVNTIEILKEQEKLVAKLEADLSAERLVLEGMRRMADASDTVAEEKTVVAPSKRRMRLGSKKRVIFQLVANGYETVSELGRHLHGTEIDGRYIRDVIRDALKEQNMHGNLDEKFILSDLGKELLEKSPLPKDWSNFNLLVYPRSSPAALTVPSPQNETPVPPLPPGVHYSGKEEVAASSDPYADRVDVLTSAMMSAISTKASD